MAADVIVVGTGVWGTAAVQAYQKTSKSVIWIDDNNEGAASDYVGRIVRAEYTDPAHRKLGKEALRAFQTQEPYSKFFHQTGWLLVQDEQQGRDGSIASGSQGVSIQDFQNRFPAAAVHERQRITKTNDVGWVEARDLLLHLYGTCGVSRYVGTVTSFTFEDPYYRVSLLGAQDLRGRIVVLATGWRTNSLLESQNLPLIDYQIVGVPVLGIQLNQDQCRKYADVPIICEPGKGEILPPTPKGIITINNPRSFSFDKGTKPHRLCPTHACFNENWDFLKRYFPDLKDCPVKISKICCDALTSSQSFYVQQVNSAGNLYCIGGGSFHSWKFLPVLPRLLASQFRLEENDETMELWEALTQDEKKHADLIPKRRWIYD